MIDVTSLTQSDLTVYQLPGPYCYNGSQMPVFNFLSYRAHMAHISLATQEGFYSPILANQF